MFSMFRKVICSVSFVLLLSLVGNVSADVSWNDSTSDHLWSTPANWATGTVPTTADGYVRIGMVPGPTIAIEGAVAAGIHLGIGSNAGELTVDGGTLEVLGGAFNLGYTGSGTLNMTSGTITLTNVLKIARDPTAIGHVNLDGGIISTNNFVMREKAGAVGTLDIAGGTLIINGDRLSLVQGYIDNGWITAYNGKGTLQMDYDVTNAGRTTLKATHMLNPNPANGSSVPTSVKQLQWTLPEPNQPEGIVTCVVYFGTNPDVEANPKVVVRQAVESVSVTLVPNTKYYWALDLYDSSISTTEPFMLCPIFTFTALGNFPPVVDAGADVVTWVTDGIAVVNLDATVTDDGALIPYTVRWTVVSEPNQGAAVIQTATAEDTGVTLAALGQYVLQLEAFDGEYTSSDTVTINVYNDSCEAAKSLFDYVPLAGDVNNDCLVDVRDFALMATNWLKNNAL